MSAPENKPAETPRLPLYLLVALILVTVAYVRLRLLPVPLERDEGEFAYMGQLLLKGIAPFTHAYTLKLPGVTVMYALFLSCFGQTATGIHLGLLLVNGLCIPLVYLLARRLLDRGSALVACASYAVLSLSESVSGFFAHATHFVVLFSLAGFLLLLRALDRERRALLLASGLCFGLALTMKQHGALLALFGLLYYAWTQWQRPKAERSQPVLGGILFLAGVLIPYALIVLWMVRTGVFETFWFWTVQYARAYASTPTLLRGLQALVSGLFGILSVQPLLWISALAGAVLLARDRNVSADRSFIWGYLLFSFLAICPGLVFRGHYFVLLLPAVALLAGVAFRACVRRAPVSGPGSLFPTLLVLACVGTGFLLERGYFFRYTPREASRASYGANPFPEAIEIGRYLKEHSAPGDRIAILGSEPEILFYADRVSATGQIYMYGLMEQQPYAAQMQRTTIREIEAAAPKYLVVVNEPSSWVEGRKPLQGPIFDWAEKFVAARYFQVGVAEVVGFATTRYLWGADAAGYNPVSKSFVTVYQLKG
jgi:hypothetical protein